MPLIGTAWWTKAQETETSMETYHPLGVGAGAGERDVGSRLVWRSLGGGTHGTFVLLILDVYHGILIILLVLPLCGDVTTCAPLPAGWR